MANSVIQTSFHAGEWAPALNARVDLAKYKAGAATMRNFFVDYRGGASSRPGTRYIIRTLDGDPNQHGRLIPFQASPTVGYVLAFSDFKLRFIFQGAPVLEAPVTITNVAGSTVTAANTYTNLDWVLINGVGGISNINGRYWFVNGPTGVDFNITDIITVGSPVFGGYTAGGTASRIYTISTPYSNDELHLLKFTQNVDKLYIVHPNHPPYVLTLISATNWTLNPIPIGVTINTPTGLAAATTSAGVGHFGYCVTAFDANGQESEPSTVVYSTVNIAAAAISTINLTWTAVTGAVAYGVYRTPESHNVNPPAGVAYGLISTVTAPNCDDTFFSNQAQLPADFSISPPIPRNPFAGPGVDHTIVTADGTPYTTVPGVAFAAPPSGVTAQGQAVLGVTAITAVVASSAGFSVGENVAITTPSPTNPFFSAIVTAIDGFGHATALNVVNSGAILTGSTPANPRHLVSLVLGARSVNVNVNYGVVAVNVTAPGYGYTAGAPAITFSAGGATATAVLQPDTSGNPTAVTLFQQRLVLAAKPNAVQTFDMSQPGSYYNFDISAPIKADDAITGSLVDGQLNYIQSMVSVPTGLVFLTSKANWLVSSGSGNSAVSPIDIAAHAHSYNGASEVPPIIANFDVLFVQSKGSIVRDLTFDFYRQIYTGTDISVLSSHLFYGHNIKEWAFAEEPYKIIWAVRDDGVLLSLTFLKEQDLIGWSRNDTQGLFESVAVVTEQVPFGLVDAVYVIVRRTINGVGFNFIERVAERLFTNGAADAWCVDSGLQYRGAPATSFTGGEHLGGNTVTGLADGVVIPPFTMPVGGAFTLSSPASVVTVGLAFTPQLKTLQLDTGEPTIQGKRKGINGVTVRVQETLGLSIGKEFGSTIPMKDLIIGNVGTATNEVVTDLVTGDARTIIDPSWDVPGQYCMEQLSPLPVTILGVIPEVEIGDTK